MLDLLGHSTKPATQSILPIHSCSGLPAFPNTPLTYPHQGRLHSCIRGVSVLVQQQWLGGPPQLRYDTVLPKGDVGGKIGVATSQNGSSVITHRWLVHCYCFIGEKASAVLLAYRTTPCTATAQYESVRICPQTHTRTHAYIPSYTHQNLLSAVRARTHASLD